MRLLVLLSILLGCANLNAGRLQLDGAYVLPRYPERAARTFISASFEIEAHVLNGTVNEIKILSSNFTSRNGPSIYQSKDTEWYVGFTNAIEDALKGWKFRGNSQSDQFRLSIVFRMVALGAREPAYVTYRLDQDDFMYSLPKGILIEYQSMSSNPAGVRCFRC